MYLLDLMNHNRLEHYISEGYITRRFHPTIPHYAILNYSDKCQYEQMWTEETMQCRGLIYNTMTDEIIARPFPKFFNYGQAQAAQIPLTSPVVVTDKMDGSLGIIYPTPNGDYAVATRGSFTSEQAIKATEMLKSYRFAPLRDQTYLTEIIYPENRIVLDYGKEEKLVLLGLVDIETGAITDPHDAVLFGEWNGPIVDTLEYNTLAAALTAEPRTNAEGMVIRQIGTDKMVKCKQEDYIRLHKLVFGLSEKAVWEHLSTHDGDITDMLEGLPDEFHGWVKEKADDLIESFKEHHRLAYSVYAHLNAFHNYDRKSFAAAAQEWPSLRAYLFMILDGKPIDQAIWKSLKPKGATPMVERSESIA